jgi:transcriptional regulator with XRE-family HTH domain
MTTTETRQVPQSIGEQLRDWRERRRLSQMELSLRAEVSTRHLSFVETGRSQPSRDMILRLAESLELPFRERNQLLLTGGYAPVYGETALDAPAMSMVRAAMSQLLSSHEPYPAVVMDQSWNLVDSNSSLEVLITGCAPRLLSPRPNALRISLHPDGIASRIVNLGEWRGHLLSRVRRQVMLGRDPMIFELYKELCEYPCDQPVPDVEIPGPGGIVVPMQIRFQDRELAFFSMVATFGTPLDITVAELVIESFFPADEATRLFLRDRGAASSDQPE